jgi:hypothetical protein
MNALRDMRVLGRCRCRYGCRTKARWGYECTGAGEVFHLHATARRGQERKVGW